MDSIFGRFWACALRPCGVIFGLFGGQDGPSSVKNASWKLINIKNVNFHQILRLPIPERFLGPQDGLQNAPRSAQDGSKRLLKRNFFGLENRLKFGLVLGPILVDFGSSLGAPKIRMRGPMWGSKSVFFGMLFLCCFGSPSRRPKRRPRGPKTPPRGSRRRPRGSQTPPKSVQEAPRGRQERPRRPQEEPKRPQEPVKRAQDPPR